MARVGTPLRVASDAQRSVTKPTRRTHAAFWSMVVDQSGTWTRAAGASPPPPGCDDACAAKSRAASSRALRAAFCLRRRAVATAAFSSRAAVRADTLAAACATGEGGG